ncbi:hypothetical protein, partial [Burkholderia sp. SIMBA_024]|uniref:hypothetical protein n=1 Tax=Burkholderia sp. SIMBA_024 TaxID=3085768 RepID=UPI00397E5621
MTDPEGFSDKTEIDALETALRQVMRNLSFAAVVAVLGILWLVFHQAISGIATGIAWLDANVEPVYSAVMGLITTFVA